MSTVAADLVALDALGPDGEYRTRNREVLRDVTGAVAAETSMVPPLYIRRALVAQRRVAPLPPAQRATALSAAATAFVDATIGGLDFERYVLAATRVSGLPIGVTRAAARGVADALASAMTAAAPAQPAGSVTDWRMQRPGPGGAVWTRRAEVFAVNASGNTPGIHGTWPQALALGYRVAIRPSRREPFTGHRVVAALRGAGFRAEDVLYLPTDHTGADELVGRADLAMVYGGQDVVDRYAASTTVFPNGPGRTKILLTAEQDWHHHLDTIVDSVSGQGGTGCVNATAVLYEGDPAPLAHAIAERLGALEPAPAHDERAVLPTQPLASARALAGFLARRAAGASALLGAGQVVADLGDGSAALRPAVHLLDRPDPDRLNVELGFPCVWVSPWTRADGVAPLRRSLVLGVHTEDDDLVDALIAEPTVTNLYRGTRPTYYQAPQIPHDGFLADFLMRNKGFLGG